ncbi:IS3 family transposase [Streptomyces sp. NPDC047985]|uniref:IS3 family transposase n=1 Tax=Streptomyces sp. NPDC047985 TaxID=3155384 RepID=UPI00342E2255
MARLLGQGYHAWKDRAPSRRQREDAELTEKIRGRHERSHGTYGAQRVHADLREIDGLLVGRKRVARLMRKAGLTGVHRRTGRASLTRQDRQATATPDLIGREFTASAPNLRPDATPSRPSSPTSKASIAPGAAIQRTASSPQPSTNVVTPRRHHTECTAHPHSSQAHQCLPDRGNFTRDIGQGGHLPCVPALPRVLLTEPGANPRPPELSRSDSRKLGAARLSASLRAGLAENGPGSQANCPLRTASACADIAVPTDRTASTASGLHPRLVRRGPRSSVRDSHAGPTRRTRPSAARFESCSSARYEDRPTTEWSLNLRQVR